MTELPLSIVWRVIKMQQNKQSHFYHRRPIVTLADNCQEETNCNVGTHQEKTNHNVGKAHPYSSR
jgi:hypothetical protein